MDITLWCRWFLSISGFDSVSGAHFSPESFQRFYYYIQIGHFVLRRRVCWYHWEVVLLIHWNGNNSMMQMVSFNFWFWFGFWCSFKPRISPEIHLFYTDWTLCPYETCIMGSLGSSVVIHWFVHISMMQMVSFNFGFWFGFWSTFLSQIIPGIHLLYSDWTLCA